MSAHHHHGHGHDHGGKRSSGRSLGISVALTFGYGIVELIGGLASGSLALVSDAGHMFTDAAALTLGWLAARIATRPPTAKHTFGYQRAEIIGALLNGLFMLAVVAVISMEALDRFRNPQPVAGGTVMLIAGVGLLLNLGVAWILHSGEQSLNTRGALLHVMGDLLGSVGALAAGVVIYFSNWTPIDPLLSLLISGLILASSILLIRDVLHVFMEGVPAHLSLEEIGRSLAREPGVLQVHDLHIWALSSNAYSLSAHVRLRDMQDWPQVLARSQQLLEERFGITHVTLQPEIVPEVVMVRDAERPNWRER
ncbi:MAG TPA: cation diffusion facilitator family transporter [Gammaproteobacteria bacterium]|nr:cation diffusion facilitator family transporter [Gammaproteobacteria bacterium]